MNAQMFHPTELPCKMKCFSFIDDKCPFKAMCQYRWAVLDSLARKKRVAWKRWDERHPSDPSNEICHLKYSDIVDLFKVYLKAGFICWYCLEPMVISHGFGNTSRPHVHHVNDFSLEHKISLADGGTNEFSNLALCCIECNSIRQEHNLPATETTIARRMQERRNMNTLTIGDICAIKERTRSAGSCDDDYHGTGARKVA